MIKHKSIISSFENLSETNSRQQVKIDAFLEMLNEEGHTFISIQTISTPETNKNYAGLRTEIIYRDNCTRKVITEKSRH